MGNFIKHYSPDLQGQSRGRRLFSYCTPEKCFSRKMRYRKKDGLNASLSGSRCEIIIKQVIHLLRRLKKSNVDVQNDWKLLVFFIGSNDQCEVSCSSDYDWNSYEKNLIEALNILKQFVPRLIVNIVENTRMSNIRFLREDNSCRKQRKMLKNQCRCAFKGTESIESMDMMFKKYNEVIAKVKMAFNNENDFAVISDPILTNQIPKNSFFSKLDCFHPSAFGHSILAIGMWNNLFKKYDEKLSKFTGEKVFCPTDADRIRID